MAPSKLNSNDDASVSSSQPESGFFNSISLLNSEKAVQELIQQNPVMGSDDHLREFSEALRTVAKALRRSAEGKAAAQAEAAEWKRKFELESKRNLNLECKGLSLREPHSDGKKTETIACQSTDRIEQCCGNNGICSHEVLRDGATNSDFKMVNDKYTRKASFKLSWCCKGEQSDQHQHDIVSFEKGNITTAERSSKQMVKA